MITTLLQKFSNFVLAFFLVIYSTFSAVSQEHDPLDLMVEFDELLVHFFERDWDAQKKYFDFPIDNSEMWYLILQADEMEEFDFSKKLTETDFLNAYDEIFPPTFMLALADISSYRIFEDGQVESMEVKTADGMSKIYGEYDKENQQIILNFYTENTFEDEKMEFSIVYTFVILPEGKLKFKRISLAG